MFFERKVIVWYHKLFTWPYCDSDWRDRRRHNHRKLNEIYVHMRKM